MNKELIDETFVMFWDYPEGIFFDAMGVCSGGYDKIYADCGEIKLNVPGLKEWAYEPEAPENHRCFDDWWLKGWGLALEVKKQLPATVDLYYMCYDPVNPTLKIDYQCDLPKIIVPLLTEI